MEPADAESRRRRAKLVAAFRDLTANGEGADVSAKQIADEAELAQADFYEHFDGIAAVAAAALIDEFDVVATMDFTSRLENKVTGTEVTEGSLAEVIRFIAERRAIYAEHLARGGEYTILVEDALASNAFDTLLARGTRTSDPEIASRLMAAGVMGVYYWWLRDGPDVTREHLAAELSRTIPSDFTR